MKKILSLTMLFVLAFTCISCDDDDKGISISEPIRSYINEHYPGAKILSAENNDQLLEVDIYHDAVKKEVYFDNNDKWVVTKWDIAITALPEAVREAINTAYPGYRIDDAEYAQTQKGVYYSIDIESGEQEVHLFVTPDGIIAY